MIAAACKLEVPPAVEQAGSFFMDGAAGAQDLDVAFAPADIFVLGRVRVEDYLGAWEEEIVDQGADLVRQAEKGVARVGVCETGFEEASEVRRYRARKVDGAGLPELQEGFQNLLVDGLGVAVILEMDGEMGDLLHILESCLAKVLHLKPQPFV